MGIFSIIISVFVTLALFTAARVVNPQEVGNWLFFAKLSGLIGSVLIAWNFILSTKNTFIEKLFGGLDKTYKVHNIIGNIGFILVVNHPIFLILNSLPFNTTKLYLVPSLTNLPYAFGMFSLYTLIILIALTIFVDLPYKLWKKTHEFMGIVIIFASLHGLLISSDVSKFLPLMLWILTWNLIAILCFLYKRFLYYLINPIDNYIVTNITHDKNYLKIDLISADPNSYIVFKPGQFAFFSLSNDKRNDHAFSILDQDKNKITIGTKIIGNFTLTLSNLTVNSKISVIGPFGSFAHSINKPSKMLWISGGIGITPFLLMARALRGDQQVTMIHSSRSDESKLFTNIFESLSKQLKNFKFIIHYSDKLGHLDNKNITSYMSLDKDTYVFLCGPKEMMESISTNLPKVGIMQKHIIFEDFDLKQ